MTVLPFGQDANNPRIYEIFNKLDREQGVEPGDDNSLCKQILVSLGNGYEALDLALKPRVPEASARLLYNAFTMVLADAKGWRAKSFALEQSLAELRKSA
jgi:hypothetical protein